MRRMSYFLRYFLVGGLAFLVHLAVLESLLAAGLPSPTLCSSAGFVAGCVVNYTLQRAWVFRSDGSVAGTLSRYVLVTACMLGLNAALFALGNSVGGLPPSLAQTIATGCVFLGNFAANKLFTFPANTAAR